jgi:hypothetical protein
MRLYTNSATPSIEVLVIDEAGEAVTDLLAEDFAAASFQRHIGGKPTAESAAITLEDLETTLDDWIPGGLIHRREGIYRLDLPTAATVEGSDNADRVVVHLTHSTHTVIVPAVELIPQPLTTSDIRQLRYRLGIDGDEEAPEENQPELGTLNVIVSYSVFANSSSATSGTISQQRATDWLITFTNAPDLRGNEKLLFTLKGAISDADSASFMQLQLSDPVDASDGLVRLLGQAVSSENKVKANLSLDDDGKPVISVHPSIAAQISPRNYIWGIKTINSTGSPYPEVREPARGSFNVTDVVTQAVQ